MYEVPLIISGFVLVKMLTAKFIKICTYAIVLEYENPQYSFFVCFSFHATYTRRRMSIISSSKLLEMLKKNPKKSNFIKHKHLISEEYYTTDQ